METFRAKYEVKYQVFGSESSLDLDICFFVETLGNIVQNNETIDKLLAVHPFGDSKKINANLAILSDGKVSDCFKGIADELNNSLLSTYSLHEQHFPLQIDGKVKRDLDLKMIRCARTLVSYFTRTHLRAEAKSALRENFKLKVDFLSGIQLADFSDFGKHGSVLEIYKSMAFQLGQTLGLMRGVELYTKESIAIEFPDLKDYLARLPSSSDSLQVCKDLFIREALEYLPNMKIQIEA